jgi:SAM-dependent methyltransferase
MSAAAAWQDVECGGYLADLEAWEGLAAASGGPILELGSGTGRVCLHLARRGHDVWTVDEDPELVAATASRSTAEELPVHAICGDIRDLRLDRRFDLVIAPMHVIQMLGDADMRADVLRGVADHLDSGGRFAAAIVDGMPEDLGTGPPPLPDVREIDGWMYSSLPVDFATDNGRLDLRRVRQAVSPGGDLSESEHIDSIWLLGAAELEAEAETAGMRAAGRVLVAAADGYIGSTIVVTERL